MSRVKVFTKKQLESIRKEMERMTNALPADAIERCHEKNVAELHKIFDEYLNKRIETEKEKEGTVEEFDKLELDSSLMADDTYKTAKKKKSVAADKKEDVKPVKEVEAVAKAEKPVAKAVKKKSTVKEKVEPVKEEVKKAPKKAVSKKKDTKEEKVEPAKEEKTVSKVDESTDTKVKVTELPKLSDSLDIAISFDTTGSMYSVLATVRRDVKETAKELFNRFGSNKLRISIIAHGDYCDKDNPYTIKVLDFTNDLDKICDFVTNVDSTYGGDADECYELVLNTARTALDWRGGSEKILMMIGDCNPHNVGYKCREMSKPNEIDWKNEAKLLNDMGVKIYGVHALHHYRNSSKTFYNTISTLTGGVYLTLDNFSDVLQLVSATCYKNHSEESYNDFVTIIKENKIGGRTLWDNIRRLNGEIVDDDASDYYSRSSKRRSSSDLVFKTLPGLNPVPAGRFQVIDVLEAASIKGFVESNGIKYKVGRAFYELTKTEDVQQYKEIILQDKESGDMYYGDEARKHLKLLPQCTRSGAYAHEKIRPTKDDTYRVFVQSTSVNRKLVANTKLLYEISEI